MSPDIKSHHIIEVGNEFKCQKLIKKWIDSPDTPSSQVIPILHKELMSGSEEYKKKGLLPLAPGNYRNVNLRVGNQPNNFYVNAFDVSPTMRKYTTDLDECLQKQSGNPLGNLDSLVQSAAKFYFSFERTHPFLDGNGRVGRMILKRILMGGGLKDLVFRSNLGNGRDAHIDAMEAVDKTGNIAYLEVYLLNQIALRYMGANEKTMANEIARVIEKKTEKIRQQRYLEPVTQIWDGFKGLDLA